MSTWAVADSRRGAGRWSVARSDIVLGNKIDTTLVIWATQFHLQKKLDLLVHNGREGGILLKYQPEVSIDTPEGWQITIHDDVDGWWASEIMMAADFGDHR
jgi:hypothetical protein